LIKVVVQFNNLKTRGFMNKLITAIAISFSSIIFACPNLEGTFLCGDAQSGKTQRVIIEQEGNVYTQRTEQGELEITADGNARNFEIEVSEGMKLSGVMVATCSTEQLFININGSGSYQGAQFAFTEKSETSLNNQGHLAQHNKGNMAGTDFENNTVCRRE
jgi:hypothetical protein